MTKNTLSKKTPLARPSSSSNTRKIVTAPVARTKTYRKTAPKVTSREGHFIISHREYVADVLGSVSFQVVSFPINPGLSSLFPWLASIANSFDSYVVHKMVFHYETTSATTTVGSVNLAIDFDAVDTPPTSKAAMLNSEGSVRTAPWTSVSMPVSSQNLKKFARERFVRSDTVAAADQKTYDLGVLYVGTSGQVSSGLDIGELYVDYVIELRTPQQFIPVLASQTVRIQSADGFSASNLFGDSVNTYGDLPFNVTGTNNLIVLQAGEYLVALASAATSASGPMSAASFGSGVGVINQVEADIFGITVLLRVVVPPFGITFTSHATAVTAVNTRIARYPFSLG